MQITKPKV